MCGKRAKIPEDIIQSQSTTSGHYQNTFQVSEGLEENCTRSCAHKVPAIYSH